MLFLALAALLTLSDRAVPPVACESLASLKLPDTTITAAEAHPAGSTRDPQGRELPGLCFVAALLRPTSDSEIRIEVWLPLSGWNGKLQAVGNGGWNGTMPRGAWADPARHRERRTSPAAF